MITALDIPRRGFLEMLLGGLAAAVIAPPVILRRQVMETSIVQKARAIVSPTQVVNTFKMTPASLSEAFAMVERWDLPVSRMCVHPAVYREFLENGGRHNVDDTEPAPRLWGATVHVTDEMPRGEMLVVNDACDARGVAMVRRS